MRLLLLLSLCFSQVTLFSQIKDIPFSFPVKAKWNEVDGFTSRVYSQEGILSYSYESNDSICRLILDSSGNIIRAATEPRWYTNYGPSIKEIPKYLDKPNYFFSSEFKCIGGVIDNGSEYVFFSNRNAGGILVNSLNTASGVSEQWIVDPLIGEKILRVISFPGSLQVFTYAKARKLFSVITIEQGVVKKRTQFGLEANLTQMRHEQLADLLEESDIHYLTKFQKAKDPFQTFQVRTNNYKDTLDLFYITKDSLFVQRFFTLDSSVIYHQFPMKSITGTEKDLVADNLSIIQHEKKYLVSYLAKDRFIVHTISCNTLIAEKILDIENDDGREDTVVQKNVLFATSTDGQVVGKSLPFSSLFKNQKIKHLTVRSIDKGGRQYLQVQTILISGEKPLNKILMMAGSAMYGLGVGALVSTLVAATARNLVVYNSSDTKDILRLQLESQMFFLKKEANGKFSIVQHGSAELKSILEHEKPNFTTDEKSRFISTAILNNKYYVLSQAEKGSNLSLEIK
ncbi:MAG: hypothetical protein V4722_06090 [Bacteroidota bacterium]